MTIEYIAQNCEFILEASRAVCARRGVAKLVRRVTKSAADILAMCDEYQRIADVLAIHVYKQPAQWSIPFDTEEFFDEEKTTDLEIVEKSVDYLMREYAADLRLAGEELAEKELAPGGACSVDCFNLGFNWVPVGENKNNRQNLLFSQATIDEMAANKKAWEKENDRIRRESEKYNEEKAKFAAEQRKIEQIAKAAERDRAMLALRRGVERIIPGFSDSDMPIPSDFLLTCVAIIFGQGNQHKHNLRVAVELYENDDTFIEFVSKSDKAATDLTVANALDVARVVRHYNRLSADLIDLVGEWGEVVNSKIVLMGTQRHSDDCDGFPCACDETEEDNGEREIVFYLLVKSPTETVGALFQLADGNNQAVKIDEVL